MKNISFSVTFLCVLVSGCAINNFYSGAVTNTNVDVRNVSNKTKFTQAEQKDKEVSSPTSSTPLASTSPGRSSTVTPPAAIAAVRLRPECTMYVPLPVPKPIRVDFKELEEAPTVKDINAIALRNVKDLHNQINEYAVRQRQHYAEYTRRCVIKD